MSGDSNGTGGITNAKLVLLQKKDHSRQLKIYRCVSLLSFTYKVFTRVVINRIGKVLDLEVLREQAGSVENSKLQTIFPL